MGPEPCPGYPLPPRRLGFPLLGSPTSAVQLEMFGDNLCIFTKRSYVTIKALAEHYGAMAGNPLEIRVHWIPLPYHHNAFFTAMGDHFVGVSALNGKPVRCDEFVCGRPAGAVFNHGAQAGAMHFAFAEAVFANQDMMLCVWPK